MPGWPAPLVMSACCGVASLIEPESLMPEQDKSLGARTADAQDEQAAAHAVRDMFSAIAPRYDLLNHVLSLNTDRYWWWRASRSFRHILRRPGAAVLDLCCGTGDMSLALYRSAAPGVKIVGADFSPAMLERARRKGAGLPVEWVEADALDMPFADGSFRSGRLRFRLSQSRQLRSRARRDLPRAEERR